MAVARAIDTDNNKPCPGERIRGGLDFGGNSCYQCAMGKVKKISIALTPDMLASLRDAVASGEYASSSEVVREALRDWSKHRSRENRADELRGLIAEGHASGTSAYEGVDAIRAEGRRRLAELQFGRA